MKHYFEETTPAKRWVYLVDVAALMAMPPFHPGTALGLTQSHGSPAGDLRAYLPSRVEAAAAPNCRCVVIENGGWREVARLGQEDRVWTMKDAQAVFRLIDERDAPPAQRSPGGAFTYRHIAVEL